MCFDELPVLGGYRLSCGHNFCPECLEGHVASKVGEGDVGSESLRCPVPSCAAPLTVGDVHAVTWGRGRTDLWERFEKMSDEREMEVRM